MNRALPNQAVFDSSRKTEMQEFLDFVYKIAIQNPNLTINKDLIYDQLQHRNLKPFEKDKYGQGLFVKRLFSKWEADFKNKSNISAFCDEIGWPYWFQFVNMRSYEDEFIKLYIPINLPHLYEGVKELFEFLRKENIVHQSKVASCTRIDNVIIRLRKDDVESARKIINFINNNKYLRTGLNRNNPFIPTYKGIGYMLEHGNSYNSDISNIISRYISDCRRNRKRPSAEELRIYVRRTGPADLIEAFENAFYGSRPIKGMDEIKEVQSVEEPIKKQNNKFESVKNGTRNNGGQQQRRITTPPQNVSKVEILYAAIKETYYKYSIKQVKEALFNAISNNNYDYFTNNNHARENLMLNLNRNDIDLIIIRHIQRNYGKNSVPPSLIERVNLFTNLLFVTDEIIDFEASCKETLEKYGPSHLEFAIKQFILYNNPNAFTRGKDPKANLREIIIKIGNTSILSFIRRTLELNDMDTRELTEDEMIKSFVNVLSVNKKRVRN